MSSWKTRELLFARENLSVSFYLRSCRFLPAVLELIISILLVTTDDHSLLLEPGCSICFIPLYFPIILSSILASLPSGARTSRSETKKPVIVVIVCGGNAMSLADFTNWEQEYLSPGGRGLGPVDISVGAKRWDLSVEDVDGSK